MGGGSPSSVTQTTRTDLPSWVKPYAKNYMELAQQTMAPGGDLAPYPYPYQQVAPFTDMQMQGLNAIQAQGGWNPLVGQAMGLQSQTMGNNAIDNPLLAQYYNASVTPMVGQMNSAALKSGGFGSYGAQAAMGNMLSDAAAKIYEPAWNQQEQLRQNAAQMSPYLMQAGYYPAQMLLQGGGAQQAQAQNVLNTGYQNLYGLAGWPFEDLNRLGTSVGLGLGSGSVQTVQLPTKGPFGPFF